MARADLLVTLVKAGVAGDRLAARNAAEALIADERAKHHTVLADRLHKTLRSYMSHANGFAHAGGAQVDSVESTRARDLLSEVHPRKRLEDLWLSDVSRELVEQLVEEQRRASLLRAQGLDPRNSVLLVGPPGNGKTSLAEAIAEALAVPFFVVRYESMIGSYLGETAGRLKRVFDYARTTPCVLFFDEFDALGKERGDVHETGEIKRVVTSLLMQVDDLPAYTVVIAATNHPELLDRAVWRRFQLRIELPPPSRKQLQRFFEIFLNALDELPRTSATAITKRLGPLSYAEAEQFTMDVKRRLALSLQDDRAKSVVERQLQLWEQRVRPAEGERGHGKSSDSGTGEAE